MIAARLLSLLWPRGAAGLRWRVVGALGLILVAKLISIVAPVLYKQIVDHFSLAGTIAVPVTLIVAYGLAHSGAEMIGALRRLIFIRVGQRAVRLMALQVFNHLHRLSLRFHLERQTGGLSRVVHRGTTGMEYLLELILFNILPTLVELALVSVILWRFYDWRFATAVAGTVLCYAAFTISITRWQVRRRREMNERDVAASVMAVDSVLNYETVKYFRAEAHEADRYDAARRDYEDAAVRHETMSAMFTVGQGVIITSGLITVMMMAAGGVAAGAMTIGDFVLVVSYLIQLYVPLAMLGMVYINVKQSLADVEAMDELLALPPEIEDSPNASRLDARKGRVVFSHVSFGYDPRRPVLEDISFEVPAGKTVALVGSSGNGKSTIGRLLFRFYDVDGGAITIDDFDVRDVTQLSLREAIGVVPQDTVLFNESIEYNIAYGRPGASRHEIEEAARLAQIHEIILNMPDGYDTRVGERGLKLSGGEKQRLAIARVVLKNPPILLFDEATSALDIHTEREIQMSLKLVSAERSTLVIAHRLSTIVDADEILVLDKGRIVERGCHFALLAHNGIYASMWKRQRDVVGSDASVAAPAVAPFARSFLS